ncbi:hypothetical protein [Prevotella sp. kh1p2]|uniref:hypothetical protein n=1 Tax=Prevotella sp. kh1p2 TaxID=1761883 RepID=UPI0008D1C784|nr:hypothetical protein [Prevotella sp. kh1p2]SET10729.1 Membrane protein involved in the export of O-antigen and teichoic acid [Prevotella sp. kh1p2]SNU11844.1 Membrane protein involved in the export of O-antigen and teichoic acid [Prevotellaceae bacterium KH2P17]
MIAKNTLLLYVRMLLTVVVSLYTSRIVLNVLGASDYGVYNVVGGVIALFTFVNTAMSGSTSRFLTFEIGKGNKAALRDTFNSTLIIHISIALGIFVLSETIGLWFVLNKLVIPEGRQVAAFVVYQASVLSMMVGVTQTPYNACIIAHEKMDIYAYVELLNVFLKLAIVYMLLLSDVDKLILYAILTLAVSVIIALIYRIYGIRHYEECRFKFVWRPEMLKPMLSFSGWNLFGNISETVNLQGCSILLNMFFGPVMNAASGIANTVQGVIKGFAFNVVTAFRPQIVKSYAGNDIDYMQTLVINAYKYTNALFLVLGIPLFIEADYVLKLWLVNVPEYTVCFVKLSLIASLISSNYGLVGTIVGATGNIMWLNVVSGVLNIIMVLLVYIGFKKGMNPSYAYYLFIPIYLSIFLCNLIILKKYIKKFSIARIFLKSFLPNIVAILVSCMCSYLILEEFNESFARLCLISVSNLMIFLLLFYAVFCDAAQRKKIRTAVYAFICR